MSKMSEIFIDIAEMLDEGYKPHTISVRLGIPVEWVYDVVETQQSEDNTEVYNPHNTINS